MALSTSQKAYGLCFLAFKPYELVCRALAALLLKAIPASKIRWRFLGVPYWAFGHLALDCEAFVKLRRLGQTGSFHYVLLVLAHKNYNKTLLAHWKTHFTVIDQPLLALLLYPFSRLAPLIFDVHEQTKIGPRQSLFVRMERAFAGQPPVLSLQPGLQKACIDKLQKIGLREEDWFVAIHARQPGFNHNPDHFRNVDIQSYSLAIQTITERGGWCIRIGDASMPPLPYRAERVWDYAHSDLKSDAMDIYLLGRCRFMLGCASGPTSAANVFGRPVAMTNAYPMFGLLYGGWRDLGIPKLIYSQTEKRILSFAEAIALPYFHSRDFVANQLEPIPNTEVEIHELVLDLFEHEARGYQYAPEEEPSAVSQVKKLFTPRDYCYDSPSSVSLRFLQRHQNLL